MKNNYLLIFVFLLQITILSAQENVPVNRKEFRTGQPGFDAAWNHVRAGNSFYSKGGIWYPRALEEYKLAYSFNKLNAALNYRMGVSALFSDSREEAADYFMSAYSLDNNIAGDVLLLMGRALIYKARFMEAEEKINMWLATPLKKNLADINFAKRLVAECQNGVLITRDTIRVEITNMGGNINSDADDYSEVLSADGKKMFFATRRSLKRKESSHYKDTKYNENIFVSENSDGKWSVAMQAGKNLNTDFCETPLYLDKSGSLLFIYAQSSEKVNGKNLKMKNSESIPPELKHLWQSLLMARKLHS